MESKSVIHVVGTRCPPENEKKFDDWYSQRHVPDLLKFKKLRRVTRYRSLHQASGYPMFLTIYEFESRADFEAYLNSPERAVASEDWKKIQKELGASQEWGVQYEVIKTWGR